MIAFASLVFNFPCFPSVIKLSDFFLAFVLSVLPLDCSRLYMLCCNISRTIGLQYFGPLVHKVHLGLCHFFPIMCRGGGPGTW